MKTKKEITENFQKNLENLINAYQNELEMADYDKLVETVDEAKNAFWAVVGKAYPNVPGDVSPEFQDKIDDVMEDLVAEWLEGK